MALPRLMGYPDTPGPASQVGKHQGDGPLAGKQPDHLPGSCLTAFPSSTTVHPSGRHVTTSHCLPLPFWVRLSAGSTESWTLSQHQAKGPEPWLCGFSSSYLARRGREGPRGTPGTGNVCLERCPAEAGAPTWPSSPGVAVDTPCACQRPTPRNPQP